MAPEEGFLKRHGIVRNAIRDDLLFFALPAILVFTGGVLVSFLHGLEPLLATLGAVAQQPRNLALLSLQNIVGLALVLLGFTILMLGHITLWRFYSSTLVIREGHRLITHGIYRLVRHPIYLGVIVAAVGLAVSVSSLWGLLIMSLLVPVFLVRIKIEERLLIDEFGEAYRAYQEKTRKLIPFIF